MRCHSGADLGKVERRTGIQRARTVWPQMRDAPAPISRIEVAGRCRQNAFGPHEPGPDKTYGVERNLHKVSG